MLDLSRLRLLVKCPSRSTVADWLLHACDAGLVGVFFVTALALGGRHDFGRLVYACSVTLAAISLASRAALLRISMRAPGPPMLITMIAVAIPVLQITPLPQSMLAWLAPGHQSLLPLWNAGSPLGVWSTVSLTPNETIESVALVATHALLFFILVNRLREPSDIRRLMLVIGCSAVGMAVLAIAQSVESNGRLLGFYDYPHERFGRSVQGTFTNKNHLAHYLTFGVAALTPLVVGYLEPPRRESRDTVRVWTLRSLVGVAAIVLLVVTSLATMSRGGAAALAAGLLVAIVIRWVRTGFRIAEAIVLAGVGCAVLVGISSFDYDRVTGRLDDLVSGQIEELDAGRGRRLVWEANAEAFMANPWLGHGAGSHRYMYPAYCDEPTSREYTHAESGYLQIASETGLAGLGVLLAAWGLAVAWIARGLGRAATPVDQLLGSCLAGGFTVSLVHSAVDFVWFVPSLSALAIAFAAIGYRYHAGADPEPTFHRLRGAAGPSGRGWWPAVAVASAALATLYGPAIGSLSWDRYLRVTRSNADLARRSLENSSDDDRYLSDTIRSNDERALRLLRQVVEVDPNNARAHSRYANRCLLAFGERVSQGENPLTLELIRDAANHGGFESVEQVRAWARRAFGDSIPLLAESHRHARHAARACPLEASIYLQGASLAFLTGEATPLAQWLEQAMRVRPHDGGVRYEAARLLHAEGSLDEALTQYRESLRMPGGHRNQLVATLASLMPAAVFLESLQPDSAATELVFAAYQRAGTQEDLIAIAQHAEQVLQGDGDPKPRDAARRWRQLAMINRAIGRFEQAVDCASKAYEVSPHSFWIRHELAIALGDAERYADAEPHLRWCLARRPDLRYLQQRLKRGAELRGDAERLARTKQRFDKRMAALTREREQSESMSSDNAPTREPGVR